MNVTERYVDDIARKLSLGEDHESQMAAVRAALKALLLQGNRGVVLADEVGFGKTYEALAILSLLHEHGRQNGPPLQHVLILCKNSLIPKWQEEISGAREGKGFQRYFKGPLWEKHPVRLKLFNRPHILTHRHNVDEKRAQGLRGRRRSGGIEVPPGLYLVNQDLVSPGSKNSRPLLKHIYNTRWDLIIFDEAHHYAKWNMPGYIFAPDEDPENYNQGISDGAFRHILALTATPFELNPREIVTLLQFIRADKEDVRRIEAGLDAYVQALERFFDLRHRSPNDPLRMAAVQTLERLRHEDALGEGRRGAGLQQLLRRYIIRNIKSAQERKYFLVNKREGRYTTTEFQKLEDLKDRIAREPLLPFDGPDALFYLELRELIQDTVDSARAGVDQRTFITTDLRQGLSSYPQIASSALLARELPSAHRLRPILQAWNSKKTRRLHPKVRALIDVVSEIARYEISKVRGNPKSWFSKILVFNKMIEGTAPQLREVLTSALDPIFDRFLAEILEGRRLDPDGFRKVMRATVARHVNQVGDALHRAHGRADLTPTGFTHEEFRRVRGKPLLTAYREPLLRRSQQSLFLIWAVLGSEAESAETIADWAASETIKPVRLTLNRIIDDYLDDTPAELDGQDDRFEVGEREALNLLNDCRSVEIVGRYDGDTTDLREAHRRNFNDLYNPFVLLASRVGEEGIDLQEQCRYVIHYDLEWNPAKLEQREGRVDRVGWGRKGEKYIDVRFKLLKGTYEERIFHTVMQRDQWFQILIGSKRQALGSVVDDDASAASTQDEETIDEGDVERGNLTPDEKLRVMLDLRPASLEVTP